MGQLAPILQEYFTSYVVTQRAMSGATIRAYRDTWRLFLTFLSEAVHVPAHELQLTHTTPAHVVAFLDYLEHERGNGAATRNLRLAAIKSVMAFHASRSPEHLDTIARISAIPVKKTPKPQMTFLTSLEAQALLDAIPVGTWTGRRDRAMFTLAIQTGLRLSEITGLQIASLHLGTAAHVACTGKGRKNRTTPLTRATATLLERYLRERATRPGQDAVPGPARRRAVRRRRPATPGSSPDTRRRSPSRARRKAHHRPHSASHRRDALPRSRRRHRRHRALARPRIHRHHERLPARRHENQARRPRPDPPARRPGRRLPPRRSH